MNFVGTRQRISKVRRAIARLVDGRDRAVREADLGDALFRTISEHSPVPTIVSRIADGTVLHVNRAFCEMMGTSAEALIGTPAISMWDDAGQRQHMIDTLRRGEPVRGFEMRARAAGGALRHGLVYAVPTRFGGEPALLASAIDITERKQAIAARNHADARLAGIVEISPDAILIIDREHRITLFNHGAEHHFGYHAEEVLGQDVAVLFPERQRAGLLAPIVRFIDAPHAESTVKRLGECVGLRQDGSEFPAKASIGHFVVEGEPMIVVMVRDSSERKATEAALLGAKEAAEAASIAKSQFLAAMSHELRTPLNAILGFSELMKRETFGPLGHDNYREYAGDILESGTHLLNLINDILDLAKVESGHSELIEEELSVAEIIRGATILVQERVRRGQLTLTVDLPPTMPKVRVDGRKLKQVVLNLLTNAVKFTRPGGKVTAKAWSGADGIVMQVIDTGIGMRVEDVPRAFALFGQIDSGLNRTHEGTGLGLPLTKSLVELHGGTLDLQSAPGLGTTVTVRLPASRLVARRGDAAA